MSLFSGNSDESTLTIATEFHSPGSVTPGRSILHYAKSYGAVNFLNLCLRDGRYAFMGTWSFMENSATLIFQWT